MRTRFTDEALADPQIAEADRILRTCVHCGFCTATCPTYVLLGDELDSPRGRIYLIRDMLERNEAPSDAVVGHIDRCLSCLSCTSTCPSGVDYMHLADIARERIAETVERPLADRLIRRLLALILPYPARFRLALLGAALVGRFLPGPLGRMARMGPARVPPPSYVDRPQVFAPKGRWRLKVALLTGCAQQVLEPGINEATVRLLTRLGCQVVVASGGGCCGALVHHLGEAEAAREAARANVEAWTALGRLDAIVVNASGCGTMVKDYGHLLDGDEAAVRISALAKDVSEVLEDLEYKSKIKVPPLTVAYHSACSLQHGQKIHAGPKALLAKAGFHVVDPPDGHLCCGSAGTYNILQPAIADRLKANKVAAIESVAPDVIAAGNIGCIKQIGSGTGIPVVHTIELLDWAAGGPKPPGLST